MTFFSGSKILETKQLTSNKIDSKRCKAAQRVLEQSKLQFCPNDSDFM